MPTRMRSSSRASAAPVQAELASSTVPAPSSSRVGEGSASSTASTSTAWLPSAPARRRTSDGSSGRVAPRAIPPPAYPQDAVLGALWITYGICDIPLSDATPGSHRECSSVPRKGEPRVGVSLSVAGRVAGLGLDPREVLGVAAHDGDREDAGPLVPVGLVRAGHD